MRKKIIISLTAMVTIAVILTLSAIYSYTAARDIENNVFRLHVLANSDSKADQDLKMKIRDKIIQFIKCNFGDIKDKNEFMNKIKENIDGINSYVINSLTELGSSDKATTVMAKSIFPTKTYGAIELPAGEYDALKVIIGNGAGRNWWCVLFPSICIADAMPINEDSQKAQIDSYSMLKNNLTQEEYKLVTASSNGNVPVKIRFKVLELFQDSKIKLSMLKNQLF